MANKHRAEIEIELGDKKRLLRLTFNSLVELEETAGRTAFEILERLSQRVIEIKTVAAVIWAGIRGPMSPKERLAAPSLEEVGEMVFDVGIMNLLPTVLTFLSYGITTPEQMADIEETAGGNEKSPTES